MAARTAFWDSAVKGWFKLCHEVSSDEGGDLQQRTCSTIVDGARRKVELGSVDLKGGELVLLGARGVKWRMKAT